MKRLLVLLGLVFHQCLGFAQFTNHLGFASPSVDALYRVVRSDGTFSWNSSDGQLHLAKNAGTAGGGITYESAFSVVGDFNVSVKAFRGLGSASCGLRVTLSNNKTIAIYFTVRPGTTQPTMYSSDGSNSAEFPTARNEMTLRMVRSGATIIAKTDRGSGEESVISLGTAAAPARVVLFMLQEDALNKTAAASVSFDDLDVRADGWVDERSAQGTLSIQPAVQVCWDSNAENSYQVQWSSKFDTNGWRDLGAPFPGTGARMCTCDPQNDGTRFYRVLSAP